MDMDQLITANKNRRRGLSISDTGPSVGGPVDGTGTVGRLPGEQAPGAVCILQRSCVLETGRETRVLGTEHDFSQIRPKL